MEYDILGLGRMVLRKELGQLILEMVQLMWAILGMVSLMRVSMIGVTGESLILIRMSLETG